MFHKWFYPKKKKTSEKSKMKELQDYYPTMKQADLNVLDSQLTTREWTEIKKQHGNDK
jgi:HPt (histidine-containing phosphotransfer) domain-containing protein|tara:strand:- start:1647 stop:1820 length:174 start_codon:yes stop_codon:yes gene_type:complete